MAMTLTQPMYLSPPVRLSPHPPQPLLTPIRRARERQRRLLRGLLTVQVQALRRIPTIVGPLLASGGRCVGNSDSVLRLYLSKGCHKVLDSATGRQPRAWARDEPSATPPPTKWQDAGAQDVVGKQSEGVIACAKHFARNGQDRYRGLRATSSPSSYIMNGLGYELAGLIGYGDENEPNAQPRTTATGRATRAADDERELRGSRFENIVAWIIRAYH
ncbi:hypothetical protein HWV62_24732 [Athelia sp. TMB]|nr:hypothetical protein HWV62_24732 [Athelia sp. TMB]